MKTKSGITLIALVITIVIMIILVGVSIGALNKSGILTSAKNSSKLDVIGHEKEHISVAYNSAFIKKLGERIDKNDLQEELDIALGENKTTVTGSGTLKVKFEETQHTYKVSQEGVITEVGKQNPTDIYVAKCSNGTLLFSNNEADIDQYLSQNSTSVVPGYEKRNIADVIYYWNDDDDYNVPFWRDDNTYSITRVEILNQIVPKNTMTVNQWFWSLNNVTTIGNLTNLNTSNVTDMSYMFYDCNNVTNLDLSNFDTSNVTTMQGMFIRCNKLTQLDLSSFDTSSVIDDGMRWMINECELLESVDVSSFDTQGVTLLGEMFQSCPKLKSLDLSSFDTSNVTYMECMFSGDSSLTTIWVSNKFVTDSVNFQESNMFKNCTSLKGGNGTTFSSSHTDKTYARVDIPTKPGYFTLKTN